MMENGWYHHWVPGALLDDQLWYQVLVMDHVLESLWGSEQSTNNLMMWTLLHRGIINALGEDSPWDGLIVRTCYFSTFIFDQFYTLFLNTFPFASPTFLL